eukprot:s313_g25.t1
MSDTLPNHFLEHLRTNPHILESIRNFQVNYRPIFLVSSGDEYTQEQRSAYLEFAQLIDMHMAQFLAMYGCTEDDFVAGLEWMKAAQEPNWFAYELCLKQIDFEYFVQMLRPDTWRLDHRDRLPGTFPKPSNKS